MTLLRVVTEAAGPLSATQISQRCHAELHFTQRLLRTLNSFGVLERSISTDGTPTYSPTSICHTFAGQTGAASMRCWFDFFTPGFMLMPSQLKANGHKSFNSPDDNVYSRANGQPGRTTWDVLAESPYQQDWGTLVAEYTQNHKDWLDFYPVEDHLIHGAREDFDATSMVDVGGCTGSQALAFLQRFPSAPGRTIILDLPDVLPPPHARVDNLEYHPHDFFTPLPSHLDGARFYYLRYIGHDWPQGSWVKILQNVRVAMTPGYSKLIIHDLILPEEPSQTVAVQDLLLMGHGGGEDRDEARHRSAIEAADLRVCGIWDPRDGVSEVILECEVAEEAKDSNMNEV